MRLLRLPEMDVNDAILEAVKTLGQGGIAAYPTETFYALGVRADSDDSLMRLYAVKGRPHDNPLPIIVGSIEGVDAVADDIPSRIRPIMQRFWPGPLTIVFKAKAGVSALLTSGTGKIAVRIPGESFALWLAKKAVFPIVATSANPSGLPPAKDVEDILRYFDEGIDLIIDGGEATGNKPSTIVDAESLRILRQGAVDL